MRRVPLASLLLLAAAASPAAAETRALLLSHGAYDVPRGAPNAVVHVPSGFRADRPHAIVLYLHGWHGCVRVLVHDGPTACRDGDPPEPGWGLARAHDAAGTQSVLVVPQLAYLARRSSAGRLSRTGYARTLVDEALDAALGPARTPAARVVVVAHSAGYATALAVLRQGELAPPATDVVLMDALYAGTRAFADWLLGAPGRRLLSIYTGRSGRPAEESERLDRWMRRRHPEVARRSLPAGWSARDAAGERLVIAGTDAPHRDVPATHLADALRALELPLRGSADTGDRGLVSAAGTGGAPSRRRDSVESWRRPDGAAGARPAARPTEPVSVDPPREP